MDLLQQNNDVVNEYTMHKLSSGFFLMASRFVKILSFALLDYFITDDLTKDTISKNPTDFRQQYNISTKYFFLNTTKISKSQKEHVTFLLMLDVKLYCSQRVWVHTLC